MNDQYSFKDYTGCNFVTADSKEFNDSEIVGSCFAQQNGMKDVFPPGMTGVHFRRCNLDNCIIPPGNTLEDKGWEACLNRRHKVMNDGEDWVIDDKGLPIEPLNMKSFLQEGKDTDPAKIPKDYIKEEEMTKNDFDAYFISKTKKHLWFIGTPTIIKTRTELTTSMLKAANLPIVTMFDKAPKILETTLRTTKELVRVDEKEDGTFEPIFTETPKDTYVKVQGEVTYFTVSGKAWVYQGQEAEAKIEVAPVDEGVKP
jgi:hypothetical protein